MYTSQTQLRKTFRQQFPEPNTETTRRCMFNEWVDYLQKDNQITEALANRATLTPTPPIKPTHIYVRLWHDRVNNNTYHSLKITYSDGTTDYIGMTYGYGDCYKQTAVEHIRKKFPRRYKNTPISSPNRFIRETLKIACSMSYTRKRDLYEV